MAKSNVTSYRVRLTANSPFPALALPKANPSKVLSRAFEELSPEEHTALQQAVGKGAFPGLTKEHIEVEEIRAAPETPPPLAGDLPEGFPGKEDLERQGFTTMEQVRAASDEDLIELEGIGNATLAKIRDYGKAE